MAFTLEAHRFDPAAISAEARAFNAELSRLTASTPKWYEIGAENYRQLRAKGLASFPPPTPLPSGITFEMPSRDAGRSIPCRVLKPQGQARAVLMHIHGGGWVLGSESMQDPKLKRLVDEHGIVCVSVGYRLAPEHPFPAGPRDCFDAAEWLVRNAEHQFGCALGFIGGESAGAHLTALTALHLLQHADDVYSSFNLKGLLLHYGCYSMRWLPSVYSFAKREPHLLLSLDIMREFRSAFLGKDVGDEALDDPSISPLYADLPSLRGRLPAALFTCGSEDYLLDDTLFMSARWLAAGGETSVTIVNGAPHGYDMFDRLESGTAEGNAAVDGFLEDKLRV
ncbi:hypothetical protein UVI_02043590 [Ustilaginoidea virens]|uniref:Alpha/beta hydrolase fold-3 domain-containing protein n=1 Tax=Ustilaginoidea virens TaxID=1159556 RepID=A0A1B5L894_USTVR|nr:hypothetical protein UVI_02043590 [Ustilaginoidea virens]